MQTRGCIIDLLYVTSASIRDDRDNLNLLGTQPRPAAPHPTAWFY